MSFGDVGGQVGIQRGEAGGEDSPVCFGEQHGNPSAEWGELVSGCCAGDVR